ncbi:MAG: hypothetical protein ACFCUU_01815 [Cyclobacteriaceae bacterium]
MNFKTIYKLLTWTGLILFIIGVIGDLNAISSLRHVSIVGLVFFIIGIFIWIPYRIKKPILQPLNSHEYKSNSDALFAFIFNNFILEFWGFCFAIGMLIVIAGGASMKNSVGFKVAIAKIQEDERLINRIGQFHGTGILVAGSTGSIMANLEFSAYGTNGGTRVYIKLEKESGEWKVNSFKFN